MEGDMVVAVLGTDKRMSIKVKSSLKVVVLSF